MNKETEKALSRLNDALKSLDTKDFTMYFFVIDCKNVPNGELQYVYQIAKSLYDREYNVKMVYQLDNEYTEQELEKLKRKNKPIDENRIFTGVGEWLGEGYSSLPHMNISKEEWKVTPSDFLFIPEAFSSLMKQTYQYKAPCKRIVIEHDFNYVTDFIPFGDEWGTYGIKDAITTSETQSNLIKSIFPYVDVKILKPYISPCFRQPIEPKKLIVNVISKKTNDVTKFIKTFYWRYPIFKFITFQDLRGYPKETFADKLKEAAFTVWIDPETPFGYSAIESMACNTIVIGKIPDIMPSWMTKDDNLVNNGLWSYDTNALPDILANAIGSWMQDNFPEPIYESMKDTVSEYTYEKWGENIENVINSLVNERKEEFLKIKKTFEEAK